MTRHSRPVIEAAVIPKLKLVCLLVYVDWPDGDAKVNLFIMCHPIAFGIGRWLLLVSLGNGTKSGGLFGSVCANVDLGKQLMGDLRSLNLARSPRFDIYRPAIILSRN